MFKAKSVYTLCLEKYVTIRDGYCSRLLCFLILQLSRRSTRFDLVRQILPLDA